MSVIAAPRPVRSIPYAAVASVLSAGGTGATLELRPSAVVLPIVALVLSLFVLALQVGIRRNRRWARLVATDGTLEARALTHVGTRAPVVRRAWTDIRRCTHAFLDAASRVRPNAKSDMPNGAVVLETVDGSFAIPTAAFPMRSEVVARRISRFHARGADGLLPTNDEVDAHRARFGEARDLAEGAGEDTWLRVDRDGLTRGKSRERATLHRWEHVVCAHVLPAVSGYPEVIQIELANGEVLDVRPREGLSNDELASLLAPRSIGADGVERAALAPVDPSGPRLRVLVGEPRAARDDESITEEPENERARARTSG